ncbi:Uncharacterised protein [Orientia tsutsugamushi]|uniref:Uncharacterized protein n=1 Tax=Orientia tsutsugamushi TaxID=784 RepID=A0A2R8F2C8_ORITS|nr:hypothetical protein [Orientia tsutsugamushi]SPM44996.1 Uncharacterised protein [Orientia tsutsugamushi]SPM45587.1 Uncharacterised protein [Orientia tsutsugamushi]SPM45859.1 Uncharacterised protein [Orientia tsutsugamushi]
MHIQVLSAAKHLFYRMFNLRKQNKATQIFSVSQEKWFAFFNDLHSHTEQKNLIRLLITHLIKIKSNLKIDQQKKCLTGYLTDPNYNLTRNEQKYILKLTNENDFIWNKKGQNFLDFCMYKIIRMHSIALEIPIKKCSSNMLINKGVKPFQEFITPEHFKNIIYLEQKLLYRTLKYYHCINSTQRKAIIKQLLLAQGQLEIKEDLNSIEKKDFDLVNTALDFYILDIMGRFKDVLEPDV